MVVGGRELIDTLWNVNGIPLHFLQHKQYELIDTLWNVNSSRFWLPKRMYRINRYIMECKSVLLLLRAYSHVELIDTLWNVNAFVSRYWVPCINGINRYIMECKYSWEPDGNSNKCGN